MDTPQTRTSASPFSTASSAEGLALLVAPDGAIERVVQSTLSGADVGADVGANMGATLCQSVEEGSAEACRLFLRSLARGGLARSTPLRLGARDVHCFGLGAMVLCVVDPTSAATFGDSLPGFEALADAIRRTHETYPLYEELARVNNDLVTAQRELARTVAELQRLNGYKDELLGMAAHDLRNPLSANAAFITFLLQDAESFSEGNRVLLHRLRSNSEYMLRLVESALDFAAIQSGHVRLRLEPCDPHELVRGVVETMRILAEARNVRIVSQELGALPPLQFDRVKIQQALQNLIGNAVQYSPDGASVEVRSCPRGEGVEIEVEDRGPGIPPEELPSLFKPFTRLSTVSHSPQRSAGLGLAITRRLVEAHGGTIDVRSEVGKGSTFVLRLK